MTDVQNTPPPDLRDPPIPPELDRWSWGAFFLNWIWGLGNNVYIALLTLAPFFGLVMPIVLGLYGNRWAWRKGRWRDRDEFVKIQRRWAFWGAGIFAVTAIAPFAIYWNWTHSDGYLATVARINASPAARTVLGTPISAGIPWGTVRVALGSEAAELTFSVSGPLGQGQILSRAFKKDGRWDFQFLQLKMDGRETPINLLLDDRADVWLGENALAFSRRFMLCAS